MMQAIRLQPGRPRLSRLSRLIPGIMLACASAAFAEEFATPSQALNRLFSEYSRDTAPYFPFTASENGARIYDGLFANNLSEEYRTGLKRVCDSYLNELKRIYRAELPRQSQLSYDIFAVQLDNCVRGFAYNWHLIPVNQTGTGWTSTFPVIGAGRGAHPFRTVQNYDDFLKRIDGFIVWIDSAIANMRIGIERGIT